MNSDIEHRQPQTAWPTLPDYARLPVNRINQPPQIVGSLSFQLHPVDLCIDSVAELHKQLFALLHKTRTQKQRAASFMDYMTVLFRLHQLEDAGLDNTDRRGRADYQQLLRGWLFDADNREAAVLKAWVESRFGLVAQYHQGSLKDHNADTYQHYLAARASGLYGTNALEAQLDLLYSYCQYELAIEGDEHITLYRGINRLQQFETLQQTGRHSAVMLLNNLNAFSRSRDRAGEFGDTIMEVRVPRQKILYYSRLLPVHHVGEDEYLVIGGLYHVSTQYW